MQNCRYRQPMHSAQCTGTPHAIPRPMSMFIVVDAKGYTNSWKWYEQRTEQRRFSVFPFWRAAAVRTRQCVCVCTSNRQNMPPNTFIRIRYISCYEFHKLWYTIAQHCVCVSVCIPFRGSVNVCVCARKCNEKLNTAKRKSKKRNTWYSRVM